MFDWYHASRRAASMMRLNCCVLLFMAFFTTTLQAESITLQNDSILSGSSGAIQVGFRENDIAASIFELPEGVGAFRIMRIEAVWAVDPQYGGLPSIADVHLYCGGLPDPGTPTSTKTGGGMVPGLNLMDVSNDGWLVRGGSPFAIGLRYNWTVGAFDARSTHIVTDTDGCQPGKNMVYHSASGIWLDPAVDGSQGDFCIRVVGDVIPSKAPFGDFNHDGFVDMVDFAEIQKCLSLPTASDPSQECVSAFDCDRNGRVNADDLMEFLNCARGPGVPLDPACGDCWPVALCNGLRLPLLADHRNDPRLGFPWVPVIIIVVILGGLFVWWQWYSKAQTIAGLNTWKATWRCAHSGSQDSVRLKAAMDYLVRQGGEGQRIGQTLLSANYWRCDPPGGGGGDMRIATGSNPKNFYGHNPPGSLTIYVDKRFVEGQYSDEALALILYSEATHFLDENGAAELCTDEHACQKRLDTFRQQHSLQNVIPEMHHGPPEGIVETD